MLTKLGPFQILEVIGRGGMGTVYRGLDPIIGRPVAVKVIRLLGYNDGDEQTWLRDRLFREARAAGSLSHPSIVTIYQVGEDQDVAYIAMEFVDGPTLQEKMKEPVDKVMICRILCETAAALDHAHKCGLVHRDIRPANIMVTASGATKVTDFGIAKANLSQTATQTGVILGTPFYMSPEQIRGSPPDGRSDQFALAVIAYEVFTGRKPFQAEHPTSVCIRSLMRSRSLRKMSIQASAANWRQCSSEAFRRVPTHDTVPAASLRKLSPKHSRRRPYRRIARKVRRLRPNPPAPRKR
jgi:serine/threonine protein kinase